MSRKVYVDRSRTLDYQRCKRLRYLQYHAGSAHRGLVSVRKSIHLVLGGAVHCGLEVLLREGQVWANCPAGQRGTLSESLAFMFEDGIDGKTIVRQIEEHAVKAALADLAESTKFGIELDEQERAPNETAASSTQVDSKGGGAQGAVGTSGGSNLVLDSPIMIEFGYFDAATGQFSDTTSKDYPAGRNAENFSVVAAANPEILQGTEVEGGKHPSLGTSSLSLDSNWAAPIYMDDGGGETGDGRAATDLALANDSRLAEITIANSQAATGMDDYLREELAAQVEAMVRAYARRRLRPLLEQFEVLEVEREGKWKLGQVEAENKCVDEEGRVYEWHEFEVIREGSLAGNYICERCGSGKKKSVDSEIWFMSRLDALLLERSTQLLYLQSYKTTGSWDRRKEADAQIDMQGLSEAVDVDRRMADAWQELMVPPGKDRMEINWGYVNTQVEPNVIQWLQSCSEPPRVLGVRYEYLLKGPRRADKKDITHPGRYVADTPLIRAYMQEGITGDDRKWAANYSTYTPAGKQKNLDYRSWRKQPIWRHMPISRWIDMLDKGEVQPEACDERGWPIDVLAEQFIQPIFVYRNEDDLRDMLEQLEAQEVQVAQDVEAVRACGDNQLAVRSELNKRFPQTRTACVFPGKCSAYQICYGSAEMRANPEASELYIIRQPNHPQELAGGEE